MTLGFVSLRRIVALSVAIALFAAPLASAQSTDVVPPAKEPANTTVLSPAAFARLAHVPSANVAPAPVVKASSRLGLLRQGTTASARQAQPASTKAPQQKSWAARHKVAMGFIIGGAVAMAMWGIVGGFGAQSFD